ncbi:MAG TPA: DM13 domain-containing protein [Mycobacteriales bacterium]|nr:DM13 domain-containing protein [Mycobacteriales bacterium]
MRRSTAVVLGVIGSGVLLAVTWAVEPNLIIGLRSPRALAWVSALGVLCAATGLVVYRVRRTLPLAVVAALVPGLAATGFFVVRPIVSPREVDEALPSAAPDPAATEPATSAPSGGHSPAGATTRVATGELRGLAGHDARGRVSTYRLGNGSHVVRFENVNIGGTPSPYVYVVPGADQRRKAGVRLGALKAEKGSFNYVLPPELATRGFTVLVWCEQFAVEIANATQA